MTAQLRWSHRRQGLGFNLQNEVLPLFAAKFTEFAAPPPRATMLYLKSPRELMTHKVHDRKLWLIR